MIDELLSNELYDVIERQGVLDDLTELRLRVDKPVTYATTHGYSRLLNEGSEVICSGDMVERVLSVATGRSMYAYSEDIVNGFLPYKGGVRIGLTGQGVNDGDRLITLKNINYLTIRIPHELKGCAKALTETLPPMSNTLIISPPACGKTTLLRDYVRCLSDDGFNVLLIDERNELSASYNGRPTLDVGKNTDVVTNMHKTEAYRNAVRAMAPHLIATDEIFGTEEINAMKDVMRCGVYVVATVHAQDIFNLEKGGYGELLKIFDNFVELKGDFENGNIKRIIRGGRVCSI